MQAAIDQGSHKSALDPAVIEHFHVKLAEKMKKGQAQVIAWDEIKTNLPPQLKIPPIPHKSRAF